MGFFKQEDWSGLPFPSPGDLLDPGTEPSSPVLKADSLPLSNLGSLLNMHCTLQELNLLLLKSEIIYLEFF